MHNRSESQEKVKNTYPLIDESVNHSQTDGIVSQDQQKEDIDSSMVSCSFYLALFKTTNWYV